jgi:hypothetical protein
MLDSLMAQKIRAKINETIRLLAGVKRMLYGQRVIA